jgi:HK97 family phage prohead protease
MNAPDEIRRAVPLRLVDDERQDDDAEAPGERTLTGRALEWDTPAQGSIGGLPATMVAKRGAVSEALPVNPIVVLRDHDRSHIVGRVDALQDREDGLYAVLRMAATPAGDEALTLAREGILTGLSIGSRAVDVDVDADGTRISRAEELFEISLTAFPAQDSARLESTREENSMTEVQTPQTPAVERSAPEPVPAPEIVPAAPPGALVARSAALPTPGEYLSAFVQHGLTREKSQFEQIMRAVADQTTDSTPGILPVPIITPVIDLSATDRPIYSSLTSRGMPPKGKQFTRPKITQHVSITQQATEKAELASQAMTVTSDTVQKITYGGTLDVSFQDIDWTEPAVMNLLVTDFVNVYTQVTEKAATSQLVAAAGTAQSLPATATAKEVVAALYAAAADIYAKTFRYPDTIWCSPAMWAFLGSLCDDSGRPVFPYLGASNAPGAFGQGITGTAANPLGARLVVSWALSGTAPTLVVGNSSLIETYEDRRGMIQALNVTQLGMDLAYYGYSAMYTVSEDGFVALELAAGGGSFDAKSKK